MAPFIPVKGKTYGKFSRTANAQAAMRRKSALTRQSMLVGGYAGTKVRAEKKFIDVSATSTAVAGASTFSAATLLNGCVPGATASDRIGRKIHMKSLFLRYTTAIPASSGGSGCVRILVVYDKQPNAATAAITDVLLASDMRSPNNLSNSDRFVTLIDEVCQPMSVNEIEEQSGVLYRKFNLESAFNAGTAGTIADITSGSILLFTAQSGGITTNAPTTTFRARVRYVDV